MEYIYMYGDKATGCHSESGRKWGQTQKEKNGTVAWKALCQNYVAFAKILSLLIDAVYFLLMADYASVPFQ